MAAREPLQTMDKATPELRKGKIGFPALMGMGVVLLLAAVFASVSLGAAKMNLNTAWGAVFSFDPSVTEHQVIRTFRLPRTLADILVGSALAVCGAIMQGTTRNPLADSGLIGISSGATFSIALCMVFLPGRSYGEMMLYACLGAGLATGITYFVASVGRQGMTPERLVLSGLSISMLFGAFSTYLAIRYNIGQALAYWTAGGTASAQWDELLVILPVFAVGLVWAVALSPSITILSFGEELAGGLGLNAGRVKAAATVIVLLLTGMAVVVVGPVGFVGLIVPHMVRYLVGVDYRRIIPASAVYGAAVLLFADILGRIINRPHETPLGIIFALVGVPFFLYLVRKQRREFG